MTMMMTFLLPHLRRALHLLRQCTLQHSLLDTPPQAMYTHSLQPTQCYLELRGEPQLLQGLPRFSLQCIISITTVLPPLPPLFSLHHLHLPQVHIRIHQLESSVKQSDRDILNFLSTSCSLFSPLNTQVDDQI